MRYAFVTGGLGFIGSHIARKLLLGQHVDRVVLLDHYGSYVTPAREGWVDYRYYRVRDIEDRIVVERAQTSHPTVLWDLLQRYQPRYIFHLAALPLASLENLTTQEAAEGSVLSTAFMLEIAAMLKKRTGYEPERFVYTSSSMVYGDFLRSPADEAHPTRPRNIYGTMKLAGEEVTRGLCRVYGIKHTIIRPSAVYGPTDMNRRVSQIFVEDALGGRELVVNGADEKLDFTYVEDVAKGFVMAATMPEGADETFNVTSGHAHSLLELCEVLREHFPELRHRVVPRDESRPRRGTLDIEKARRVLGYAPDWNLRQGIAAYVEFMRCYHGVPPPPAAPV
jgi:UDP-glucose 4-epimerase